MSLFDTETEGGQSGSHSRTTGQGSDRQSGRARRRVRVAIGAVGAAAAVLVGGGQVLYQNDDYQDNFQMIRSQTGRNTNHDNSAFRDLEMDKLDVSVGGGLVDTNRQAYLGNPNGNPEQSFPITAGGQFRISCEFSHFAYDDPILFPDKPGGSHLHMFFGNTDINAFSTYETMNDTGSSTCNGQEANRTGYWVPAMIDGDGNVRIPERIVVYYKGEGYANGETAPCVGGFCNPGQPYGSKVYDPKMANIAPMGQTVVEYPSGDGGTGAGLVNYKCTSNFSPFQTADGINTIPNCDGDYYQNTFNAPYPATRTVLEMDVRFWHCFDDSGPEGDWTDWVPAGGGSGSWYYGNCSGHGGGATSTNETYPNLEYFVNYVVEPGEDTSDWFLSSDVDAATITSASPSLNGPAGSTHHGDWWGAWNSVINKQWIDNCVNFVNPGVPSGCGFGYLTDGGPNSGSPASGPVLKYRPQYDTVGQTSSYKTSLAVLFSEICQPLGPSHSYNNSQPASGAYCKP